MQRGKELKKLDKIMQEYYRGQELSCEVCGGEYSCKHHYVPKSQSTYLRYDDRNLISICTSCHFKHHKGNPDIHAKILKDRGWEWHNELQKDRNKIVKLNQTYIKQIKGKYENTPRTS